MRKLLTATIAAVMAAGAIASTAGPAQAERYRYYGDRNHNNNNDAAAAAIIGGVLGLALGAAIAGSNNDRRGYYDNRYYGDGYYGGRSYYGGRGYYDNRSYNDGYYGRGYSDDYGYARPYSYGYGARTCTNRERVYDPYTGRRVVIERRYAC